MSPDHPPPRDRRYSDEEFRWILEQATREPGPTRSRAEEGARSAPEGFSLDTIREVAREVGISEAAVDRAAASLVITVGTVAFYRLGARAAPPEEIRGFLEELQRAVSVE